MIIAIDFDGTIAENRFPDIGPVLPQAINCLKMWRQKKHKLILWTCREGQYLQDAIQFCMQHGIVFDAVNENLRKFNGSSARKVWADLYVDDKCGFPIQQVWMNAHQRVMRG